MSAGEPESEFEAILAALLERIGREGWESLETFCRENPGLAERVRGRIASLRLAGLLPSPDPTTDVLFSRYRVVRPLGRGAMGVVFLADDLAANRRVALKTCAFTNPDSARERERFLREGAVAQRLSHENIVPVLDVGCAGDIAYLAMEPIAGATLAEVIARLRARGSRPESLTTLDVARALAEAKPEFAPDEARASESFGASYVEFVARVGRDVARALSHVHQHGIVHRDVKPSNLLLERSGRVLLFDLGLAHVGDAPALTRTGEFAGSPYYASPEQIAGKRGAIDARTDVYSLGVTLHELLALEVPFHPEDAPSLFRAIQYDDPPPLRELSPRVPRDLEVIVATALEKDPSRRYPDADALASDLDRFLGNRPIMARAPNAIERAVRNARRRPAATFALGLLAFVLLGSPIVLAWFNRKIADERDQATFAESVARREAERNLEVSRFWEELVLELDSSGDASMRASAVEILRRGAVHVGSERLEQPLSQALVLETLGRVHLQLARPTDALSLFDQALALRSAILGESHVETATALYHLARTHLELDHRGDARALARRSLAAFASAGEPTHEIAALAHLVLGDVARREGEGATARAHLEDALAALGPDSATPDRRADALERLGETLIVLRDDDGAIRAIEESLELRRGERRPRAANIARGLALLARLRAEDGDAAGATEFYSEAFALDRKAHGDVHPEVAARLEALASLLPAPDSAIPPERHAFAGECLRILAANRRVAGSPDADATLASAIAHLERGGTRARRELALARIDDAESRLGTGDLIRAEESALAALAGLGDEHPNLSRRALAVAAEIAARRGALDLALAHRERALAATESDPTATPRELATAWLALADARNDARTGNAEEAARTAAAILLAPRVRVTPPALALDSAYPLRQAPPDVLAEYDREFQRGITALQSARRDEAIAHFERCLLLVPRVPICSYNVACAKALVGDVDGALSALDRAVDDGFGFRASDLALLETDADLGAVRADARFARLLERVSAARDEAARESAEPAFFVPDTVDITRRAPLLVVLHRHASSKARVLEGPWKQVARELGMILVAPSGQYVTRGLDDPGAAMTWIEDVARYERRAWLDARPVVEAIAVARKRHRVDPSRVFLAGEGIGGLIAFDVALRAPSSIRGVLLHDAPIHLELARDLATELRVAGLRLALVPERGGRVEGLALPTDGATHAPELAAAAESLGVDVFLVEDDDRALASRLSEGVARLSGR